MALLLMCPVMANGAQEGGGGARRAAASPLPPPPSAVTESTVERWAIFELALIGPADDGTAAPFELDFNATFRSADGAAPVVVRGFFDGADVYKVRFSPPREGRWNYSTNSAAPLLRGHAGGLTVTPARSGNHGPVQSHGFGFVHADGTPHFSVGTTSYQWPSQPLHRQAQTLETLRRGTFNKMRMAVFPKWYVYNHANPVQVGAAFEITPGSPAANASVWGCVGEDCPSIAGSFDLRRFNVSYWQNFERLVAEMQRSGVIADIIAFHPYDRGHWGFDCMGGTDPATYDTRHDKAYLRYLSARLAAFSNVWWAMANEWDFCGCKSRGVNASAVQSPAPVWDDLFQTLRAEDPYRRQMSIHNGALLYNHSQPWITHVSLQGREATTAELRAKFGKPVVWDEVRYEGDLPCCAWGSLSGEEEADRFWWGASLGVYVGHSETVLRAGVPDDEQPLWWAKGGELIGRSPARIQWLREVWRAAISFVGDFGMLRPSQEAFGSPAGMVANVLTDLHGRFVFLHFSRIGQWRIPLPRARLEAINHTLRPEMWQVAQLDYWSMTSSNFSVPLGSMSATLEEGHKREQAQAKVSIQDNCLNSWAGKGSITEVQQVGRPEVASSQTKVNPSEILLPMRIAHHSLGPRGGPRPLSTSLCLLAANEVERADTKKSEQQLGSVSAFSRFKATIRKSHESATDARATRDVAAVQVNSS
ncbi:hypothetical protein AB1Y20_020590 [Prymnesium parvum]|uniref:DUF5060 domain-containing protein n=1 Tax=Prymnesium parvum TaxID=97485 RepID=A0AB34JXV1_PRYPA